MPRPCKLRKVSGKIQTNYFKPQGIPLSKLKENELLIEEFETLKLVYTNNLSQEEAAKKMEISQPTFSRILSSAIKKVSDSIVNGKAIKINNS